MADMPLPTKPALIGNNPFAKPFRDAMRSIRRLFFGAVGVLIAAAFAPQMSLAGHGSLLPGLILPLHERLIDPST